MDQLFDAFLKEKLYLKNLSAKTQKSYREAFAKFKDTELSTPGLNSFVIRLRESGLSPVSCNIHIRSINSFLTWLNENGHTGPLKIRQLKEEKRVKQGYSDEELSVLLSFVPRSYYDWRLHALICTLVDTGCRIDELLKLTWEKIDFDNLLLSVVGKGNKERVVPISLELRKVLFKFSNRKGSREHSRARGDFVFRAGSGNRLSYRNILRDFERLCHKLKVPYKPFHYLRRTFARNYITQGGSLFMLQRCLGHESITTTQRYVALNVEDLKETHQRTSLLGRLR